MELRSLRCQDVVIAKVAGSLCTLCDIVTLLDHVGWHSDFRVRLVVKDIRCFLSYHVGVKGNCPITFDHEIDLSDVPFLFDDVTVILCGLIVSGHKSKSNLVDEVTLDFSRYLEKETKGRLFHNVLKQKLCHNYLLNFEGNSIEVLTPFQQD